MNISKTKQEHRSITISTLKANLLKPLSIRYCFLLAIFTLTSCSKDDSPAAPDEIMPTIDLYSGEEGIYLGVVGSPTQGVLQHQIIAKAPDGFVSLEIFKVLNGVTSSYLLLDNILPDDFAGNNTYIYTLNYDMNNSDEARSDLSFKAIVKDINDNTATIDFAKVDLRLAMIKKTVTLKTLLPPVGSINIPNYLRISGTNVVAVNQDVAINVNYDQDIAMVLSSNDDSGFYIGSLNVVEPKVSNNIQQKSTTKFKYSGKYDPSPIFSIWNVYDVHNLEHAFSVMPYNSHEQKAEKISTIGKAVYFKTDDNRIGIFQVKGFSLDGEIATLILDILVTQP